MYRMPTEWEQDVAEIYVNYRKITRPDTNIKKALISVFVFLSVTSLLVLLVYHLLITVGIATYLPYSIQVFYNSHPSISLLLLVAIIIAIELFFCFKYAVIGAIKLYQHYAPEEIRRRCLFKPTCSEYAIIAVRKYGGIIGLCKSYYRLMYLCRGSIYKIDYPWDKNS